MKKFNPVISSILAFLSILLALFAFDAILFITILILSILGAVLNSMILFGFSALFVIVIAGSFVMSALIGCTQLTVSICNNKWICLFMGGAIVLFFIVMIFSTNTVPPDNLAPDNAYDVPAIIYDIPMVIYGLAVAIYGFFSGEPGKKDQKIAELSETIYDLSTVNEKYKAEIEELTSEIDYLNEEINHLYEENADFSVENDALRDDLEEMGTNYNAAHKTALQYYQELQNLKKQNIKTSRQNRRTKL